MTRPCQDPPFPLKLHRDIYALLNEWLSAHSLFPRRYPSEWTDRFTLLTPYGTLRCHPLEPLEWRAKGYSVHAHRTTLITLFTRFDSPSLAIAGGIRCAPASGKWNHYVTYERGRSAADHATTLLCQISTIVCKPTLWYPAMKSNPTPLFPVGGHTFDCSIWAAREEEVNYKDSPSITGEIP